MERTPWKRRLWNRRSFFAVLASHSERQCARQAGHVETEGARLPAVPSSPPGLFQPPPPHGRVHFGNGNSFCLRRSLGEMRGFQDVQ